MYIAIGDNILFFHDVSVETCLQIFGLAIAKSVIYKCTSLNSNLLDQKKKTNFMKTILFKSIHSS